MDICDKLIDLRIALITDCDGFSVENGNKNILLSTRIKILYLLEAKDMTPAELISILGIAKSNLANLSKIMIEENVIESYKTMDNLRNVYYRITSPGLAELSHYKSSLHNLFCSKHSNNLHEIEIYLDKILEILKKD